MKESFENIMTIRKEMAEERNTLKAKELEDKREAEERRAPTEERKAEIDKWKVAMK